MIPIIEVNGRATAHPTLSMPQHCSIGAAVAESFSKNNRGFKMRRADREITDFNEIVAVMKQCDVCRLALKDSGYPYIVPLNFGMSVENNTVTLYFHSALEGRKLELIKSDNRVSFEMDCCHKLVTDEKSGSCTMNYKSVIGRGTIEFVPNEEKLPALKLLMSHYHEDNFLFNENIVPHTCVYKLTVKELTGKKREKSLP